MNENNTADVIIKALGTHPYISAFLLCIAINPFFLGATSNIPANALWIETIMVLTCAFLFVFKKYKSGKINKPVFAIICIAVSVADFFGVKYYSASENKALWHFFFGCILLIILCSFIKISKRQMYSGLILGIGFFLKLYYVLQTSCYTRQNDIGAFGKEYGHAGYIEYLLFNHKLPDFDVREVWQFCHPPLHHIICAFWIDLNENFLLVGRDPARESLQTLTLFYSMCIMISAYKILRHFKLEGASLYIPLLIISFHPAFILLSGSINNDILSVAFMMGAAVSLLKWQENPTLKNIMKISLCIGLGMMTKLSAALVAIPTAIVFLIVFIRKIRTDWKRLIGQFFCFGVVCVPLGLWYEIRNYIKWKVPITYVQELGTNVLQYIGDQSFKSRITDFSPKLFENVFEQWAWTDSSSGYTCVLGYNEYNPLIALLKNSLFGEGINSGTFNEDKLMINVCTVFFWTAVVIAAIAFISMLVSCFTKNSMTGTEKTFFAVFYFTMVINFYKMAKDYPFTCTLNFRYITPTVITGAVFLGTVNKKINSGGNVAAKCCTYLLSALALLFALLSAIVYISVGYVVPE